MWFTYQEKLKGSKNLPSFLSDSRDVIPQKPGRWRFLSVYLDQRSNDTTTHEFIFTLNHEKKKIKKAPSLANKKTKTPRNLEMMKAFSNTRYTEESAQFQWKGQNGYNFCCKNVKQVTYGE